MELVAWLVQSTQHFELRTTHSHLVQLGKRDSQAVARGEREVTQNRYPAATPLCPTPSDPASVPAGAPSAAAGQGAAAAGGAGCDAPDVEGQEPSSGREYMLACIGHGFKFLTVSSSFTVVVLLSFGRAASF
jgi:hypothetical protein